MAESRRDMNPSDEALRVTRYPPSATGVAVVLTLATNMYLFSPPLPMTWSLLQVHLGLLSRYPGS